MILKRDQVADILIDALTELRFPLDDPPLLTKGEVVPIATSLYSEPHCWVRIRGWKREGDDMVVSFKRAKRPREPRGRFMVRPREPHPADLQSASGITYTDPDAVARAAERVALCDEPEFVSDAFSSKLGEQANGKGARGGYTDLRHRAAVEQARDTRQEWTPEKRVEVARTRAKQQRVDVSHELHIVVKALEHARSGGRKLPAAALKRLETVEALLDGVREAA